MAGSQSLEVQERQISWMADHHRYLLDRFGQGCKRSLEVGCGAGLVMEALSDMIYIRGVDIDPDQVLLAKTRGLDAIRADGISLPFPDSSFDLVVSSFYLMWVKDKGQALKEMIRVASRKVIILAEPIWSMTIMDPSELEDLHSRSMNKIRDEGGDPDSGLEVLNLTRSFGLNHRYGTVPMDTSPEETLYNLQAEADLNGMILDVPEPILFNVPFIWVAINPSR